MAYTTYDTPAEFFNISPTATAYDVTSATLSLGCSDHATAGNRFLTNLTAAQADEATGSTAQVVFGLVDGVYQRFNSIATDDRPTKFSMTRSGYTDETTNELVYTYSITCRVAVGSLTAANT